MQGYLLLYPLALYVIYATPNRVSIDVQGGVYVVGTGDHEGFYPKWVAT